MIHALFNKILSLGSGNPNITPAQFELDVADHFAYDAKWNNTLAVATNTAIGEQVMWRARRKARLVGLWYLPAAAVTGTATDFFTLVVRKRTTAAPGTQVAIASYAADTATTDDAAAFGSKDLYTSTYLNGAAATAYDFALGDVLTVEVTKSTATGMTFPISTVFARLEPRD